MIDWITLPKDTITHKKRDFLPKDKQFLALWKGAICIAEYDEEDNCFWISFYPAQYGQIKVAHEREQKFTHYALLELPKDY